MIAEQAKTESTGSAAAAVGGIDESYKNMVGGVGVSGVGGSLSSSIGVGGGTRRSTRIEGMEALEQQQQQIQDDDDNLSEAEKRMREEELSFYSASDNKQGDDNIWGLLSGVGGNIYEW